MKKKIINSLLLGTMLATSVIGLAACAPQTTHTHEYGSEAYYTVHDNKAFKCKQCFCGDEQEIEILGALIATPQNAQTILDGNINNRTIIFDGEFNDIISLRPTKATAKIYKANAAADATSIEQYTLGDELTDELQNNHTYHYLRDVKNVKFAATNESKFNNLIYAESIAISRNSISDKLTLNTVLYDAVKELPLESTVSYFSHVNLENIEFDKMNFYGKNGRIVSYIYEPSETTPVYAKNISITNCSFTTNESSKDTMVTSTYVQAAINFTSCQTYNRVQNITVKNCVINGHNQGVALVNFNNVTLEGNTISNTEHNAIALQTADAADNNPKSASTGNVTIKNNIIFDIGKDIPTKERAIRFGVLKNANVVIENNNFTNCAEDRTAKGEGVQLLATQSITTTTIDFKNNIYNNEVMQNTLHTDDVAVGSNFTIKISE